MQSNSWIRRRWDNNNAESINNLLKLKADWKQLPTTSRWSTTFMMSCVFNTLTRGAHWSARATSRWRPVFCHTLWTTTRGWLLTTTGKQHCFVVSWRTPVVVTLRTPSSHQTGSPKCLRHHASPGSLRCSERVPRLRAVPRHAVACRKNCYFVNFSLYGNVLPWAYMTLLFNAFLNSWLYRLE